MKIIQNNNRCILAFIERSFNRLMSHTFGFISIEETTLINKDIVYDMTFNISQLSL